MERIYVAYGSNMNKAQMKIRCPHAKAIGKGTLHGYSLEFRGRDGGGVATIIEKKNTSVPVALWRITDRCEKALDVYEGFPNLYYKKTVSVELEGETVEAMVYIMARKYESKKMAARPSTYYYNVIREGYRDFGIAPSPLEEALNRAFNAKNIPDSIKFEIIRIRDSGKTNMLDIRGVILAALELDCSNLVSFLEDNDNHKLYADFIIYGD